MSMKGRFGTYNFIMLFLYLESEESYVNYFNRNTIYRNVIRAVKRLFLSIYPAKTKRGLTSLSLSSGKTR